MFYSKCFEPNHKSQLSSGFDCWEFQWMQQSEFGPCIDTLSHAHKCYFLVNSRFHIHRNDILISMKYALVEMTPFDWLMIMIMVVQWWCHHFFSNVSYNADWHFAYQNMEYLQFSAAHSSPTNSWKPMKADQFLHKFICAPYWTEIHSIFERAIALLR